MKKSLFISFIIFFTPQLYTQSVFIIIHGTWGADSSWYTSQGDFFEALENTVKNRNSSVVSFRWSGGCGHASRVKAAEDLAKLIKTYNSDTTIYLIAHSHGGNVATLACQLLAQDIAHNRYRIRGLFALGTPVMDNYLPNMDVIYYVYNLFSFEDLIQTVLGISLREYPQHRRITNMRVFIDGKEPDHSNLHHPLIGTWIPYLHYYYKHFLKDNGIMHTIGKPSIVYLTNDTIPKFILDTQRIELLDRDRRLSIMMINALRKRHLRNSLETESKIPLTNR